NRRHAGKVSCIQSTADAGGNGRAIRIASGCAAGHSRTAGRGKKKTRQSSGNSQHAEFSDLQTMARERERLVRFSTDRMARPDSAALLQLSRDGWPRNNLHRRNGFRGTVALARKAL